MKLLNFLRSLMSPITTQIPDQNIQPPIPIAKPVQSQIPPNTPLQKLKDTIIAHEGIEESAYQDSLGYWTIGVGRLIDKRKKGGLSRDEIMYLLENDIREAINDLSKFPWFNKLDEVRKGVMIEMVFNIGLTHLMEFKNTLHAIEIHDFLMAGNYMHDSLWAKQVGENRAGNMIYRLKFGKYPDAA